MSPATALESDVHTSEPSETHFLRIDAVEEKFTGCKQMGGTGGDGVMADPGRAMGYDQVAQGIEDQSVPHIV